MQIKKRLLVGGVCGALLIGTMVPALAATVHYNDGSTVGGSAEWTGPRSGTQSPPTTPRYP